MLKIIGIWLAALTFATGDLADNPHPRLWMTREAEGSLHAKLAADPLAARLQSAVMVEAERILKRRTCRYEIPDGRRLLAESRLAFHNIAHSAWAWRMGGGGPYRQRTIAELEAACSLKDWNTSHFLDTAEMATAVAIGYDWLYDSLTPAQRKMCEQAIVEKALKPAAAIYQNNKAWSKPGNNWSQVCGAGIALAAAAIAGHDEGLAENLFSRGLALVNACDKFYQPDGMYPEGPGYWHYGTNYHVMMLAACKPLGKEPAPSPILRKAGDSIMHLSSPTRLSFNFADGNPSHTTPSPAQCWLASKYRDTAQSLHVRDFLTRALDDGKGRLKGDRWFPLSVLWLPAAPAAGTPLPNAAVFNGEQSMAIFRSGWDAGASWLAIKGGTPAASHGHMDVGSFAYDAHGSRWIHDLGSENYNLPGYFGKQRWSYFRLQNRSHNTLEIGGELQNASAKPCPLISSSLSGNSLTASFDLTDAYADSASSVVRTAGFDKQSGIVRINDEIKAPAGDVVWRAHTDAVAEVNGDTVTLRKGANSITLRRISKAGKWSVTDTKPPTAEEQQNKSIRAVVLTAPKAEQVSLAVEIRP